MFFCLFNLRHVWNHHKEILYRVFGKFKAYCISKSTYEVSIERIELDQVLFFKCIPPSWVRLILGIFFFKFTFTVSWLFFIVLKPGWLTHRLLWDTWITQSLDCQHTFICWEIILLRNPTLTCVVARHHVIFECSVRCPWLQEQINCFEQHVYYRTI